MNERTYIAEFAKQFARKAERPVTRHGTPYLWGGEGARRNGEFGFDCSGFVIFLLRPFGALPKEGDWPAQQLAGMFYETDTPEPGDLVFYGASETRVTHVMVCLGAGLCVGATGGTSRTTSVALARKAGAEVKIETVNYRKDVLGYGNIFSPRRLKTNGGSGR